MPTGRLRFQGSRERLLKMIRKYDGTLLSDNRFTLFWNGAGFRYRKGLSFRFHCTFEEAPGGFDISWRLLPTGFTLLRILIILIAFLALAWNAWNTGDAAVFPVWLLFGAMIAASVIWDGVRCVREFTRVFTVETGQPRKKKK